MTALDDLVVGEVIRWGEVGESPKSCKDDCVCDDYCGTGDCEDCSDCDDRCRSEW